MKKIIVEVEKYEAIDGKVFDTEEKALIHEDILKGLKKYCPDCCGTGQEINVWDGTDRSYTGKCRKCNGNGYLTKKIVWE